MAVEISEDLAREALRAIKSPARNPEFYHAVRVDNGWRFGWREDAGRPKMGTLPWVVADNGRAGAVAVNRTSQQVIEELNSATPV